jgi:hypothetical protein
MAAEVRFKKELLDELLAGHDAKTVFEDDGLLDKLKKALAERILTAELDHHLGQEAEQSASAVFVQHVAASGVRLMSTCSGRRSPIGRVAGDLQ